MDDERNHLTDDEFEDSSEEAAAFQSSPEPDAVRAVERYSHCHNCGANLHFSHVTDFIRNLTQETSRCPECGNKARRVIHRLQ
jgi:hypothetical protein